MTQEDLALSADVHRTYVSQLERDLKSPTIDVLFRLCKALKKRPSKLLEELEKRYTWDR